MAGPDGGLGESGGEVADGVGRGPVRGIGQPGRTAGVVLVLDGVGELGQHHGVENVHVVKP
ncbi:hypothetical protein OG298_42090 [Streptomyces sp. NBC_01005]|uniref:hypothetical protein n=1 Tax=unclassified Streptomyces TaxID=2593676 RepID=UPI002E3722D1|nr:hypothetical protein [Streptomyces sp. NBC_01362]WSW10382.1 hypothetical protein OG298_42090 [Streptomyces sp. NBC_01005]WTC99889.1 hypothetical protein OH736_42100 [Streptomyces sp. NBC_01650]